MQQHGDKLDKTLNGCDLISVGASLSEPSLPPSLPPRRHEFFSNFLATFLVVTLQQLYLYGRWAGPLWLLYLAART